MHAPASHHIISVLCFLVGRTARPCVSPRLAALFASLITLALIVPRAFAQDALIPPLSPALASHIDAPYLTDDERRDLRIEHGLWRPDDLDTPARIARAALIAAVYTHPVFDDPETPAIDRAEAMLERGDPLRAIELIEAESSLRAARIRAQARFDLARFDEADNAVRHVVERMLAERIEDAAEVAEGVRALMLRARILGSTRAAGGDFRTLMQIIENARDNLDRLSWRVRLAEAELLYDKHNRSEAAAAATEALALNPRSARALALFAEITIDSFAFDEAEILCETLDELAEGFGTISPHAALARARMRLRQRDTDAARESIEPLRKALPTHREALAMSAAVAAAAFDEAASAALLDEFDRLSPGSPIALYEVGRTLSEARQYDDAIDALDRAAHRLENWSHPWIALGLVLIQAGRDAVAEPVLEHAAALDPFDTRAANSLELVRGLKEFQTIESDHFIVRYMPGIDAILAREMLPVLESIHARVCADPAEIPGGIGHEPDRPTLIEIMPSHRWFSVRISGMTRIHTMAAATGPVIAMESPQEGPGFTVGPFDWPRVIQHEYTHTITLSRTRNRIPHWFTEAAAVYCEDGPRDERNWKLLARAADTDSLFDLDEINTAFVRPRRPTDRSQAYAQGHWMYEFIIDRWGPSAPVELMDRYAAGETEASAFEGVLGVSKDAFMDAFLPWARDDLRRVGLSLPEDVPTISEMLEADRRETEDPESIRPDADFVARWSETYPEHPQLAELLVSLALLRNIDEVGPRLDQETIDLLEGLVRLVPVSEQPHRLLARHHLAGDERHRAIPHIEFLDAREQNSPAYARELAELHAARGDMPSARRMAERASRIAPFDPAVREFAARVATRTALDGDRGAFNDAERHIAALVELEPGVDLHKRRLERLRALANPD